MPQPLTFPALALVAAGGAALGVHLGHASIAEIDPAILQGPVTRFYADLVPHTRASAAVPAVGLDPIVPAEPSALCIGCRPYPQEYFPAHDPIVDRMVEGTADSGQEQVRLASYEEERALETEEPDPDLARVHLYANFEVSHPEDQDAGPADGAVEQAVGEADDEAPVRTD